MEAFALFPLSPWLLSPLFLLTAPILPVVQILRPLLGVLILDLNLFVDLDEGFARWLSTVAVLCLHPVILFYMFRLKTAADGKHLSTASCI